MEGGLTSCVTDIIADRLMLVDSLEPPGILVHLHVLVSASRRDASDQVVGGPHTHNAGNLGADSVAETVGLRALSTISVACFSILVSSKGTMMILLSMGWISTIMTIKYSSIIYHVWGVGDFTASIADTHNNN